jgi:hypothetical protein
MTHRVLARPWILLGMALLAPDTGARGQDAPPPAGAPQAEAAAPSYEALVERLKAGDRTVDFARLRTAFTETPQYNALMMAVYQSMWRPLSQRDFPAAITAAEAVLERNYVEVNAHMVAAIAFQQTGDQARSEFHRVIAGGLLRAIVANGDGKTPETAYRVIDVSEEFAVVRSLNLTPNGSSTSAPPGGPRVDAMRVTDPRTGTASTIYFNVDTVFERGYRKP